MTKIIKFSLLVILIFNFITNFSFCFNDLMVYKDNSKLVLVKSDDTVVRFECLKNENTLQNIYDKKIFLIFVSITLICIGLKFIAFNRNYKSNNILLDSISNSQIERAPPVFS